MLSFPFSLFRKARIRLLDPAKILLFGKLEKKYSICKALLA
jgi:hypothetical protein